MNNYKSQYQKYYANIKKKAPIKSKVKEFGLNSSSRNSIGKNNVAKSIMDKLIKQSCGAIFLLALLLLIKYIPLEEAKAVYALSKESVNNDLDLEEVVMNVNIQELNNYKEKILEVIENNIK